MQHRDKIILEKVISEINIGIEMMGNMTVEEFMTDEKLKRATSMTVINIGELIKNISQNMREENTNVPWKAIAGMRDIAAHKYQTLRVEDVYNTVLNDLPILKKQIEQIIHDKK